MDQQEEYYYSDEEESSHKHPISTKKKKKKKERENTKRFSDEQVKFLESVFSCGAKIESRKKQQLASDIGLEPRQVSIWFQNKRARWKTKQLEQEYKVLKNKFDDLYEKYDSLKKEKENLLDQFNTLRRLLENSCNEHNKKNESEEVTIKDWGNRDEGIKENKEDILLYEEEYEHKVATKYLRQEEELHKDVNFCGQDGYLLASPHEQQQQQHNLVSTRCLLDEPCCPSSWWEL